LPATAPASRHLDIFSIMLRNLFRNLGGRRLDESLLEEWEETLVMSDVSLETTDHLISFVRDAARRGAAKDDADAYHLLRLRVQEILDGTEGSAKADAAKLEAARIEAEKAEAARLESDRLDAARREAEARAQAEAAKLEAARVEAERREAARLEAERAQAEAPPAPGGLRAKFNPFARFGRKNAAPEEAAAPLPDTAPAAHEEELAEEPTVAQEALDAVAEEVEAADETPALHLRPAVEAIADDGPSSPVDLRWNADGLTVWLFVGVNGVGKTTSIGKLAAQLVAKKHRPLLVAGDTFRAAAIEQLQEWGKRANCEVVSQQQNADPAAVVFDGLAAARARDCDVVLIDTAGRLHNKSNLMNELAKIARIVERETGLPPQETLLVIDASTGQNGLTQAQAFAGSAPLTGLILTKWDGTAKGGIVLTIAHETGLPVKLLGVGEKVEDLCDFDAREWTNTMFGTYD
jgi:fused signal recognition particle receptor